MSRTLLAASLAGCAGIVLWVLLPLRAKPIYALSVPDFLARDLREQEVRVSGHLVPGSLCRARADCGYRFAITEHPASEPSPDDAGSLSSLWVNYESCALPDTFRDLPGYSIRLAVEGERCQTCHDFEAHQVLASCSGNYRAPAATAAPLPARPPPRCDAVTPKRL